jgi:hypothetical protein
MMTNALRPMRAVETLVSKRTALDDVADQADGRPEIETLDVTKYGGCRRALLSKERENSNERHCSPAQVTEAQL